MKTNVIAASNMTDGYKCGHIRQYPEGTEYIHSNLTPRTSRTGINKVVFFGLQYAIKNYLIKEFNETFFSVDEDKAVKAYKRRLDAYLFTDVNVDHVRKLHRLGHLPVRIKALKEGSIVPLQCPMFTIENTNPEFGWVTNYLETILSATIWLPCTSATTANEYRRVFDKYAVETGSPLEFVPWQGHDFSFRGMAGLEAACMSGSAHLLSFTGTDTIPAIDFLEKFYNADCEKEIIGGSVNATEHAVMCAGGEHNETETYRRLIEDVYPTGIVSIVSDTWDFWNTVTVIVPSLKDKIMKREGKVVIRPDSGEPQLIICGDKTAPVGTPEHKGLIECLWESFGGTVNEKGYKVLDSHIGAIYGDSITLERQLLILEGLKQKGFASCNIVLGIGSYTYQYVTRDTYGFAVKATHATINGENREIFKNPKTDSKKKSHRGLIAVVKDEEGNYTPKFPVSREFEESNDNLLEVVFENGKLVKDLTLCEIRETLKNQNTK